ncbi:hypothetical protein NMY22_g9726 [Coprinellus aureogranulatus]|nr:hypothetical protein NMY22_g9726 [Coprinellus aureogranulatus]
MRSSRIGGAVGCDLETGTLGVGLGAKEGRTYMDEVSPYIHPPTKVSLTHSTCKPAPIPLEARGAPGAPPAIQINLGNVNIGHASHTNFGANFGAITSIPSESAATANSPLPPPPSHRPPHDTHFDYTRRPRLPQQTSPDPTRFQTLDEE